MTEDVRDIIILKLRRLNNRMRSVENKTGYMYVDNGYTISDVTRWIMSATEQNPRTNWRSILSISNLLWERLSK